MHFQSVSGEPPTVTSSNPTEKGIGFAYVLVSGWFPDSEGPRRRRHWPRGIEERKSSQRGHALS